MEPRAQSAFSISGTWTTLVLLVERLELCVCRWDAEEFEEAKGSKASISYRDFEGTRPDIVHVHIFYYLTHSLEAFNVAFIARTCKMHSSVPINPQKGH
jgi:hypothetical protein